MQTVAGRGFIGDDSAPTIHTWAGNYPPRSPAEWIADGHVTCCVQCLSGECDRRMVECPGFVCRQCGAAGSVNITPKWHDRGNGMIERNSFSARVEVPRVKPCL